MTTRPPIRLNIAIAALARTPQKRARGQIGWKTKPEKIYGNHHQKPVTWFRWRGTTPRGYDVWLFARYRKDGQISARLCDLADAEYLSTPPGLIDELFEQRKAGEPHSLP